MEIVLLHPGEIFLKGKNRPIFLNQLKENIKLALKNCGLKKIIRDQSSILLFFDDLKLNWPLISGQLKKVIGIANFALVSRVPVDFEKLQEAINEALQEKKFKTFRVMAKRAHKGFPLNSEEINRRLGAFVVKVSRARVDLIHSELTIFVEVLAKNILFYFEKIIGAAGLPVGTSGRVAVLLSGGIDSPVAAWKIMRRGCRAVFIHFHSYPYLSRASQDKAKELVVKILNQYQFFSRLYLVPLGAIQRQLALKTPAAYLLICYRRLMVRLANLIAQRESAKALVTGESLGQVASQTLENLTVIGEASVLPILRPLIGADKQEIIVEARQLQTYDISIVPDQDCCQLFVPKHPATKASLKKIIALEKKLPIDQWLNEAMKESEILDFRV